MTNPRQRTTVGLVLSCLLLAGCGTTVSEKLTANPPGTSNVPVAGAAGTPVAQGTSAGSTPFGHASDQAGGPNTGSPQWDAGGEVRIGSALGPVVGPAPGAVGRGFDAHAIYIGVTTSNDTKNAASASGYKGIDPGDVNADTNAVLADINRKGGLFGRELVARFHDEGVANLTSNPDQSAQNTCTAFTQDTPVVIVINTLPAIDGATLYQCLANAKMPFVTTGQRLTDDVFQRAFAPYYQSTIQPSWDALAPIMLDRLSAMGYFTGWDTNNGAPGKAPLKIGLLFGNSTVNTRVFTKLAKQLAARGYGQPDQYQYDISNAGNAFASAGAGVLRFKADGVTHVIVDEAVLSIFSNAAEQQKYRPRYAMQTVMDPASAKAFMPTAQLNGILGVGWSPSVDVDIQPKPTPAQQSCTAMLRAAGKDYTGNATAQTAAFGICDALQLSVAGFRRTASLVGPAFRAGFLGALPTFRPASTFTSNTRTNGPSMVGSVRDFGYVASCGCLRYASTTDYLL